MSSFNVEKKKSFLLLIRFNLPGLTARLTSPVQTEQNLSPQIQLAEKISKGAWVVVGLTNKANAGKHLEFPQHYSLWNSWFGCCR